MSSAALELVCPHCRVCWMRWTIDLEKPFDKQLQKSATGEPYIDSSWELPGAVRRNSPTPGGYYQDSDGNWYRWARGEHASLPEGEIHPRQEFICPNGCRSDPQAGVHKRDKAAVRVLRELHDTRASVPFRTTVDKLLPFAKKGPLHGWARFRVPDGEQVPTEPRPPRGTTKDPISVIAAPFVPPRHAPVSTRTSRRLSNPRRR